MRRADTVGSSLMVAIQSLSFGVWSTHLLKLAEFFVKFFFYARAVFHIFIYNEASYQRWYRIPFAFRTRRVLWAKGQNLML